MIAKETTTIATFESEMVDTGCGAVFLRRKGAGPAVSLLHGFPETHLMWNAVAPLVIWRSGLPKASHLPGLPRVPAAETIGLDEGGRIDGLF